MPNNISSAVGTARQFTPQPDARYVGNYQNVSGGQVATYTGGYTELAQNILRLNDAFQSYMLNHEKVLDAKGHIEAERMINGMTPEDIKRLNTIDAAQHEGYVDQTANPYFKAYAEKLRGQFMSTQMKNEYDLEYSMNPAKSLGEEAQRYAEFSSKWKQANIKGNSAPSNIVAFNAGFDESQLVNANNLATNWVKKKNEEDVVTTVANLRSKVGAVVLNAPELLKTKDALTKAVQNIFNESRLMGVPIQYRQQILEQLATDMVKTGHIQDWDRFKQMMENITIQTSMDGSSTKAYDLLDMQTYKTYASQYSKQFHTQAKYDFVQNYRKKGIAGYKEAMAEVDRLRKTDPEKAEEYNALLPQLYSQIEADEREKKAALRASLRGTAAGGGSKISNTDEVSAIFNAWCNGNSMYGGKPIGSLKLDEDALLANVRNQLAYAMSNQNSDMFFRVLDMPQMSKLRDTVSADIENKFASLRPTDDGGVNIGGDEEMINFFRFMYTNANNIEHSLGSSVAKDASILKTLVDTTGDFDSGLRMMSYYTNASDEDKSSFKQAVQMPLAGLTTEGIINAGSNNPDIVYLEQDPMLKSRVEDLAIAYMCQGGYSANEAVQAANRQIANNFYSYHYGAFPKGIANNLGIPDPVGWFTHGLDAGIWAAVSNGEYETASEDLKTSAAEQVHITYNDNTQTFEFNDWAGGGRYTMSLEQVRDKAKSDYQRAIEWASSQSSSSNTDNDTTSVEEYNQSREAINNAPSTAYEAEAYENKNMIDTVINMAKGLFD